MDEILTARQNLVMFGQQPSPAGRPIIEQTNCWNSLTLTEPPPGCRSASSPVVRRRLDLAASLIVSPVLFVDEPTTGLDPSGRREVWAAIRSRVSAGTTVLLTTQYLKRPINCAIVSPC